MCLMNNQLTRKQELAASRVDVLLRLQLMNENAAGPPAASRSADGFLLVWRDFKALLLVHEGL